MKNDFTFTVVRQKAYFCYTDNTSSTDQLSGISAKIANMLIENVNETVTFVDIIETTHGSKPDFFLQRTIDVHLCKVKKFFESKGYEFTRERQHGVRITKALIEY